MAGNDDRLPAREGDFDVLVIRARLDEAPQELIGKITLRQDSGYHFGLPLFGEGVEDSDYFGADGGGKDSTALLGLGALYILSGLFERRQET
jgi:hypothetical protein